MKDYFRCCLLITLVFILMIGFSAGFTYTSLTDSLDKHSAEASRLFKTGLIIDEINNQNISKIAQQVPLAMLSLKNDISSAQWQANTSYPTAVELLFPILGQTFSGVTESYKYQFNLTFTDSDKALIQQFTVIALAASITFLFCLLIIKRMLRRVEDNLVLEISNDKKLIYHTFPLVTQQLALLKAAQHKELVAQHDKIESLSKQINIDSLTGLYNRFYFRGELTELLNDSDNSKSAILALIRATALSGINKHSGFQHGDDYLKDISKILVQTTTRYPDCQLYRISGPDFALIIPKMTAAVAHKLARELKSTFDEYQALHDLENVAYVGLTTVHAGQQPEQVLSRADTALAKAQVEGVNCWAFQQQDEEKEDHGQTYWKGVIEEIIEKRSLLLLSQPVQSIHRNMKNYQEIYTRFIGSNNAILPTHALFAMAQRLDYTVKLDQMIIENIVSNSRTQMDGASRWGVNLASHSVQSSAFIVWLERLLLREPNIAANLVFEIDETVLERNLVTSKRAIDMLRRVGSRSAISRFGQGIGSFKLFKELKPDYIKIDSSLVTNINTDSANQQFLRMIIDVAHRLGCQVIAEGVEELVQKQILESMYIDGIQGYLIARPAPLSKIAS